MSFHPNDIARRTRLSSYGLTIGFFLLLSAFFNAQVLQTTSYKRASEENRLRAIPLPAPRGIIYDRKGQIIAENLPAYSVSITAPSLDSLRESLKKLQPTLQRDRCVGCLRFSDKSGRHSALRSIVFDREARAVEAHLHSSSEIQPVGLDHTLDPRTLCNLIDRDAGGSR